MRFGLVIFIAIFVISFTSGALIIKEALSDSFSFKEGQVLGVSEFAEIALIDLPIKNTTSLSGIDNKIPVPELIENSEEISIIAEAGVVIDSYSGKLLFNKDSNKVLPVASITKLATALVFLDYNPGWESIYEIQTKDLRDGGRIYLSVGEKVKVKDLFYLSLVGSANTATMALVHSSGMSEEEFIQAMNNKMTALGFTHTRFSDPVGLHASNISTAFEVAQLAQIALGKGDISEATLTKRYDFTTLVGVKKFVANTDLLLDEFPQNGTTLLGGKTGYLEVAGYCFVAKFKNSEGREVISAILGDISNPSRFKSTKELVEWVFNNYEWH